MPIQDPKDAPTPDPHARPLWEDDSIIPPTPRPEAGIPPEKPRVVSNLRTRGARIVTASLGAGLKSVALRAWREVVEVGRATVLQSRDLSVYAALSARAAFASWRARDAVLRLGRRALTTMATQGRTDEPAWRSAERDGAALQRGALILDRGEVPGVAPLEYGRAVAAQASLDRARRSKEQARTRLQDGGRERWIRFVLGLALIATLLFFWNRPRS